MSTFNNQFRGVFMHGICTQVFVSKILTKHRFLVGNIPTRSITPR